MSLLSRFRATNPQAVENILNDFHAVLDELVAQLEEALQEVDLGTKSGIENTRRICDDLLAVAHVRILVTQIVDPR